jgi:hypothetical protein
MLCHGGDLSPDIDGNTLHSLCNTVGCLNPNHCAWQQPIKCQQ